MNDEFNISIEEVMKITHKSREFIINAIQQGTFPGSVDASGKRRNVHIPRKAFDDKLEVLVDKKVWPMPSYSDLLFEV